MDETVMRLAQQLLESGLTGLDPRAQRAIVHVARRLPVARDVNSVVQDRESFGERLADRVARLGGSWGFILVFAGMLVAWVVVNSVVLAGAGGGFDPYPFIFLNLILSMVAAFQAPVILMSQNRQAARDRVAASLDYEVNLKAEMEIMALHEKLERLQLERLDSSLQELAREVARTNRLIGGASGVA